MRTPTWAGHKRKLRLERTAAEELVAKLQKDNEPGFRQHCDDCDTQRECKHRSKLSIPDKRRYDINLEVHRSPWLLAPAWCKRGMDLPTYPLEL